MAWAIGQGSRWKRHYTKKWLDGTLGEFVLAERGQGGHTH